MTFDKQLTRLEDRGLAVADRRAAIRMLKRVGYYRLSAYWYPFRLMDTSGTATRRRLDEFHSGAEFDKVAALYEFDSKLRSVLMQGLETLEVSLRVQLAYALGKIDPFAHIKPGLLDSAAIAKKSRTFDGTEYEAWIGRYEKRCNESENEDYVRHFREKYDGRLPIWAATELLDFGAVVRLVGFLPPTQVKAIANAFGLKRTGDLNSWIRTLNVVRNHCAHHARMWNRSLPYPPARARANVVPARLGHLEELDSGAVVRVYYVAAILGGLLVEAVPTTNWPRTFKTVAKKLPEFENVSTISSMGFPEDWDSLALWNYDPSK